ncbi:hypothetical protein [Nemorincola caseinilytica]
MKHTFCTLAIAAGLLFAQNVNAQEAEATTPKKKHTLTISNKGIHVDEAADSTKLHAGKVKEKEEKAGKFRTSFSMLDVGVNMLNDNTVYTDPSVVNYLNVPAGKRNAELFDLKPSKSINVNIYPLMVKFLAVKTKNQRIYLSTGIGFQVYNFRFEEDLSYTKNPNSIIMDTIKFSKNKLAVNYLNVPLMLTGKTRLHKKTWLTYGAGITAGYRLSSWNKQISGERGKKKLHGNFDLEDYNACLTAEFGIDGILRFYGSYQLTPMYNNGIDQRPICVGIRFSGI